MPDWVFPTPVGVFLVSKIRLANAIRLPHARGGVSRLWRSTFAWCKSSPRPWGCFQDYRIFFASIAVFPTPVGVFLYMGWLGRRIVGLPHARGGVSTQEWLIQFVNESSPRPWGCFYAGEQYSSKYAVFPTPVGVFLEKRFAYKLHKSLPHARGGVSQGALKMKFSEMSSPRPWGCFRLGGLCPIFERVFPTPVGVFLSTP